MAVMPLFQPGYLQKLLPESAPDEPEALEDILSGTFFVKHLNIEPRIGPCHFLAILSMSYGNFILFSFN